MKRTITVSPIVKYLDVGYTTFDSWLKYGILGDKFKNLGKGQSREFNLEDIYCAKIAKEVINLTKSLLIATHAVRIFRKSRGDAKDYMRITCNSSTTDFSWVKNESDAFQSEDKLPRGQAILLVPITDIKKDVNTRFPDLIEDKEE